ncbi:MAG: cellulase family glycosylhydrolase [Actinomycetes bacterium]
MSRSDTQQHRTGRTSSRGRFSLALAAAVVCVAAGLGYVLFSSLPGGAGAVQAASIKGVVDWQLEQNPSFSPVADSVTADRIINQMTDGAGTTPGLHARWTRLLVYWDGLQPTAPSSSGAKYRQTYVDHLKMIVTKLTAKNVNVILSMTNVPQWASNKALWSSPPKGVSPGYQPFYAVDYTNPAVMTGFRNMAAYLASTLGPLGATKFEVWNEPNISRSLFPQRKGKKLPDYGLRVYRAMLQSFWSGVKSVNRSYTVIAGGTAPYGNNSTGATSPIVWANNLKKHNMSRYFDAYSHHPYTIIGSRNIAPNQLPPDPAHMVNLANLSVLLRIYPTKPFYLTEFGYGTGYNPAFGVKISPAKQAAFLTQAFALARSHKQVKVMLWYVMRDWAPDPAHPTSQGVYTGLMSLKGSLKPAWTAFARIP